MTDQCLKCMEERNEFLKRLELARKFFGVLARAGETARDFFLWAHGHKVQFIPLFDFDVICGSLPSVIARHKIENPQYRLLSYSDLDLLLGPHSIFATLLLSGTCRFTLPPGTVTEIASSQRAMQGSLSATAESWMKAFQQANKTRNPESTLLLYSRQQSVTEVLLDEFLSFNRKFDDLRMLENIYSNHEPFENFVLEKSDRKVTMAYNDAIRYLKERRESKPRNNRCDALNISSVVRMFNNPQIVYDARPAPLFITETKEVHDLSMRWDWYDLSQFNKQPPILFNRVVFLQVYLGFLAYHDFSNSIAAKEVSLFIRESRRLEGQYRKLADEVASSLEGRQGPQGDSRLPKEWRFQCEAIEVDQRDFDNYWGRVTQRVPLAGEHDRVLFINLLENNTFRRSLCERIGRRIKKGEWDGLLAELRSYCRPEFDIWRLLNEYYASTGLHYEIDVQRNYCLTYKENIGELLHEEFIGTPVTKFKKERLFQEHEFRFLVHRRNVSTSSVLCVDTWRYEGHPAYLSILWSHVCDKKTLWKYLSNLAFQMGYREDREEDFLVEEFPIPQGPKKNTASNKSLYRNVLPIQNQTTSFEITFNGYTLFADVVPIESLEMQTGIVVPLMEVARIPLDDLAETISETSIFPISVFDTRHLLKTLLNLVSVVPDLPEEANA